MKKYIALITALTMIFAFNPAVFADEPTFYSVGVTLVNEIESGAPKAQTLVFELRDADTGQALGTKTVEYSSVYEAAPRLEFAMPGYSAGKRFILSLTEGEAELIYGGVSARSFTLETYSYLRGDSSELLCNTEFFLGLRPATERFVNIYLDGMPRSDVALYPYPEGVLMPVGVLDSVGISPDCGEDGGVMLTAGDVSLLFYPGQSLAYSNGEAIDVSPAPMNIGGELYVPAAAVADAFDCGIEYSDDGRTLNFSLDRSPLSMTSEEKRINALNISSDTDFLIWISKSEYTVRVFTGSKNHWRLAESFPCAIGAPGSPTIEGTFKYYQRQDRWSYPSYYCGPIMRFYRGYAIHSVLMRYDGSYYDSRVGMRISHGCVRLRPENIDWMASTIPLQTTVYVTA